MIDDAHKAGWLLPDEVRVSEWPYDVKALPDVLPARLVFDNIPVSTAMWQFAAMPSAIITLDRLASVGCPVHIIDDWAQKIGLIVYFSVVHARQLAYHHLFLRAELDTLASVLLTEPYLSKYNKRDRVIRASTSKAKRKAADREDKLNKRASHLVSAVEPFNTKTWDTARRYRSWMQWREMEYAYSLDLCSDVYLAGVLASMLIQQEHMEWIKHTVAQDYSMFTTFPRAPILRGLDVNCQFNFDVK